MAWNDRTVQLDADVTTPIVDDLVRAAPFVGQKAEVNAPKDGRVLHRKLGMKPALLAAGHADAGTVTQIDD